MDVPDSAHPEVSVRRSGRSPKTRRYPCVFPFASGYNYVVYNSSVANLTKGIVERVLYVKKPDGELQRPPEPTRDAWGPRFRLFFRQLIKHLPSLHPVSRHEFAAMYAGRRRTVYEKAADSLLVKPVTRGDAAVRTFTKCEKVKPGVPRVIQPRDPRYNVEVGRYIKPLEGPLYRAIHRVFAGLRSGGGGGHTVAKGLNVREIGRVIEAKFTALPDMVAIGLDASRFDQHTSVPALKAEHRSYLRCFPKSERAALATLLGWQLDTKGRGFASDGRVKYHVSGGRMSGDMNTALGNCLLMCSMVYLFFLDQGIKGDLINNGDDCVIFIQKKDLQVLERLPEFFLEFGYTMKVEAPAFCMEHIEFCQMRPVRIGGDWVMVRDPRKSLAKDSICLSGARPGKSWDRWLAAVGECNLALCGGVPVMQEFASLFVRESHGAPVDKHHVLREAGSYFLRRGLHPKVLPVDDEARYSFWKAFGILPDTQIDLERILKGTSLGAICPVDVPVQAITQLISTTLE